MEHKEGFSPKELRHSLGGANSIPVDIETLYYYADLVPFMIWKSDAQALGIYFNLRWLTYRGVNLEEEVREGWWRSIHGDDRKYFLDEYQKAASQGTSYELQAKFLRSDGVYRSLHIHGTPVFNQEGSIEYYISAAIDITERKDAEDKVGQMLLDLEIKNWALNEANENLQTEIQERKNAEAELKEREARFQSLAEATMEGIVIHEGLTVLDINTEFQNMTGYTSEELKGTSFLKCVTEECWDLVRKKTMEQQDQPYEVRILHNNGVVRNVEVREKPFHYQGQDVRIMALRDVTRARQLAKKLEEMNLRMNAELEFAALIQKSFMVPESIALERGKVTSRYMPCDVIAGDYLEIFTLEHFTYIVSADISGHGLIAALFTFMLNVILKTTLKNPVSHDLLLQIISREMKGYLFEEYFLTISVFVIDQCSQTVYYGSAGHPPFMVFGDNGVQVYQMKSTYISNYLPLYWSQGEIVLKSGERLLVFTDGLFEILDGKGGVLGVPYIKAYAESHYQEDSSAFLDGLIQDVCSYTQGGKPEDDISVCIYEQW